MKHFFITLTILLVAYSASLAQWSGSLTLGTSFNSGNINKFDIASNGDISHKDSLFEFSSYYKMLYSEVNNLQNSEEYAGGIKFDYQPYSNFTPFILGVAYQNFYKNIELRTSALAGAKYRIFRSETADYSFSAAVQYDINRYIAETEDDNITRLSFRPKIKQKLGDYVTFEHVTFYQPNISAFDDFLIDSTTSLKSKVTDILALQITYNIEYVNKPTKEDLKKTDQYMLASLVLSF